MSNCIMTYEVKVFMNTLSLIRFTMSSISSIVEYYKTVYDTKINKKRWKW